MRRYRFSALLDGLQVALLVAERGFGWTGVGREFIPVELPVMFRKPGEAKTSRVTLSESAEPLFQLVATQHIVNGLEQPAEFSVAHLALVLTPEFNTLGNPRSRVTLLYLRMRTSGAPFGPQWGGVGGRVGLFKPLSYLPSPLNMPAGFLRN